jgi:hypothetical protein
MYNPEKLILTKNNGESYKVLYITERGVDLFFELLAEEIELRLGEIESNEKQASKKS